MRASGCVLAVFMACAAAGAAKLETNLLENAGFEGQATGAGSLVKIHLNARDLVNHRDVFPSARERQLLAYVHSGLLERGFLVGTNCLCALSTANTEKEIDDLAGALEDTLRDLRLNGPH